MRRRSFLGAVLALPSIEILSRGLGLIPIDGKWVNDPFIKIFIPQDAVVHYKNHIFSLKSEKYAQYHNSDHSRIFPPILIPLDSKSNQKTKEQFVRELGKNKVEHEIFDIVSYNGNSNLFATYSYQYK